MEERKIVKERYLKDYLIFGWSSVGTENVRYGKKVKQRHIVTRQTTINNYTLICELEKQYFHLCKQHKTYKKLNPIILIVLLLLGGIPGFIYLGTKVGSKASIEKKNAELEEQKGIIAAEVRELRRYKYIPDKPIF